MGGVESVSEQGKVEYSHRLRDQEQGMDPEHDNSEPTLDGLSSPAATDSLAARYDILGELGHGGMGIVYRARDRETGEVVALKVLKPEIATHPEVIERFKAELRLARKITHKNVCRTYELLRIEGTIVITMEYVEGESLRAFLSRYGSVPLRKGLEWAAQICGALSEAHAQGVIHRDLKPENILIDRQGNAKVMDFGIARSIATEASLQRAPGMVMGTPAYMSPEQAEGKPADARSDIYSVGLIFYEMFAGKRAFHADTPADYIHKQVHDTPALPREVEPLLPGFLDRAIQKCLEKNPNRRFQSVAEMEAAFVEKVEEKAGEPASPETDALEISVEVGEWQQRDSWLLGGGGVAALLFFALFGVVYPFSSLRLQIGQGEAVKKAVAAVQKFDPAAAGGQAKPYWQWWLGTTKQETGFVTPEIQQAILIIYKNQSAGMWWLSNYPAMIRALGLQEANRELAYEASWEVQVDLGPQRAPAKVGLRNDGSLTYLDLPAEPGKTSPPLPTREQATRDSVAYVRQAFGTDVGNLEPKWQHLPRDTRVSWELPGPLDDLKRIVDVRFAYNGSIGIREDIASRRKHEISEEWVITTWQDMQRTEAGLPAGVAWVFTMFLMLVLFVARRLYQGAGLSVLLGALCITMCLGALGMSARWQNLDFPGFIGLLIILTMLFLFARRLYQEPRRSASLMAMCVTLSICGIWIQDHDVTEFMHNGLVVIAIYIAFYLFHFCLFATAEDYLWRRMRTRIVTWFALVRHAKEARAAGLSILRGCALGLIFLAIHTLVIYALGSARVAGPSTMWLETAAFSGRPYLALYALSYAIFATVPRVWCIFGFPAALAAGITRRPFAMVAVPAGLFALMPLNLPGTTPTVWWLSFFISAFQGLAFSLVFYYFDLLTLAIAVFTAEIWLLVYPVWTFFSAIDPVQPSLAMLPWFLLLTAGAIIYLRPQLKGALQRVAAVFE